MSVGRLPQHFECWEKEATFPIGGDPCTRCCDFCQIDTSKPQPLDRDEPRRVAESMQKLEVEYATITGVARDDLPEPAFRYDRSLDVIPSARHHPIERWVEPEEFVELKTEADEIGFAGALSGPLVRSSYRTGRLHRLTVDRRAVR